MAVRDRDAARTPGAARAARLPARLCASPRILFVGINPSLHSARVGHHFAGPGNPFYRLLHAAGLVPRAMTFEDDVRLPGLGLALTNVAERATREAAELSADDYARGRRRLARTIAAVRPGVVAFVGSTAYRQFVGPSASSGPGPKPEVIGGARVFVVPNPSGRNAAFPGFRDKLVWFRRLARWAEASAGARASRRTGQRAGERPAAEPARPRAESAAPGRARGATSRPRMSRSARPARPHGPAGSAPRR
jgi:double-stranded uracil-DNA glycosylase